MFELSSIRRLLVTAGVAGSLALGAVLPASAHVVVSPSSTAAGSYSLLTFSFGHGCDGSATTELAIQIPEGVEIVRPAIDALWSIETVSAETDATAESGHAPISEVVFTANEPVPDGYYASVQIQVQLPDGNEGDAIAFPVIQTCETGESAWIQIPDDGQSADDLDTPAPVVTLSAAVEGSGH
ncbi:MAG: YcnI family protein [Thermomicrobiales bacterium]|nr:YcnI family protein [Thermomicrobiales bacterium]MCO5219982.1 YcnI family protein [Thermomicrobiales bacterium]